MKVALFEQESAKKGSFVEYSSCLGKMVKRPFGHIVKEHQNRFRFWRHLFEFQRAVLGKLVSERV